MALVVTHSMQIAIACLIEPVMWQIVDLYPVNAKTNQRDEFVIAQAVRTMSHSFRILRTLDEDEPELSMITGFDNNLARKIIQTRNRIRGLFTQNHPGIERTIGTRLDHSAIHCHVSKLPCSCRIKRKQETRTGAKLKKHGARRWQAWTNEVLDALSLKQ
ncbi:IS110 family transposase [Arcanobacterium phocae]|uniref:IS110 family transposase n=2 Tax=Arcanobacterium phocae TaxID=131112 RepID=UPI002646A0AE|nr:transposase [Arcanobacterium phocae]